MPERPRGASGDGLPEAGHYAVERVGAEARFAGLEDTATLAGRRSGSQQLLRGPHSHQRAQQDHELERELQERDAEVSTLTKEAQQLKDQIQEELASRSASSAHMSERLRSLEQENERLRGRLTKLQLQDSAKLSDVTMVKKDVVWKTMELEKALREFQQAHQDHLFSRLWSVTGSLMTVCGDRPDSPAVQFPSAAKVPADDALSMAGLGMPPAAGGEELPGGSGSGGGLTGTLDAETQQALKRRLQSLGDVVVYSNAKYEACAVSGRAIPPGALRIRPRRCDHVFLVESLMPYWADGICPVCRCSFAYDHPQDTSAAADDIDRYSSVSLSVSQVASLALPRPPYLNGSNSEGSLLRGSRAAHGRGRSASHSRRRSPSQGARSGDRTERAERRQGSPPSATRRERSASPPRSEAPASPRSQASSARREQQSTSARTARTGRPPL